MCAVFTSSSSSSRQQQLAMQYKSAAHGVKARPVTQQYTGVLELNRYQVWLTMIMLNPFFLASAPRFNVTDIYLSPSGGLIIVCIISYVCMCLSSQKKVACWVTTFFIIPTQGCLKLPAAEYMLHVGRTSAPLLLCIAPYAPSWDHKNRRRNHACLEKTGIDRQTNPRNDWTIFL